MLKYLQGTIESDEEIDAASDDDAEDQNDEGASFKFDFDDGVSVSSSRANARSAWNFEGAIKTLTAQGAKQPFELLTEDHFAAKRKKPTKKEKRKNKGTVDEGVEETKKEKKEQKKQKMASSEKKKNVPIEDDSSDGGDDNSHNVVKKKAKGGAMEDGEDSDENEESSDDDDDAANEEDENKSSEGASLSGEESSSEEEEEEEEEPQLEDTVRNMAVTVGENKAQVRAERRKRRAGGGDDEAKSAETDAAIGSLDDDAAAREFFDEYESSLPPGVRKAMFGSLAKKGKTLATKQKKRRNPDGNAEDGDGASDDASGTDDDDDDEDEEDEDEDEQGETSDVFFSQLNLSRPLMRGVEDMGFVRPTPIQARVLPIALAGRDVCGSAKTGSGKTAAFLLPCLERLLYRPPGRAATRVLVVSPTRELAAQCHAMGTALAKFCEPAISIVLITGGVKNLRPQEAELRKQPDVVVCTPGRMLDHLTNSAGCHFDDLNVLTAKHFQECYIL